MLIYTIKNNIPYIKAFFSTYIYYGTKKIYHSTVYFKNQTVKT